MIDDDGIRLSLLSFSKFDDVIEYVEDVPKYIVEKSRLSPVEYFEFLYFKNPSDCLTNSLNVE